MAKKMKEGILKKADEVLASLDREYDIDSGKARELIFILTTGIPDNVEAGWLERRRAKKTSRVSFANQFANARTNYERFRPANDYRSVKCAQDLVDWFNIGLTNGIFKRRRTLNDQDLRALILSEMYRRKRAGEEILTAPKQYGDLFGVDEQTATFNLEYLLDNGLVEGQSIGALGTTKKYVMVHDISNRGIDAVEGRGREKFAINYNVINITGPVTGQVAAGGTVSQVQGSGTIKNFGDLYQYVERNLTAPQTAALKPLLEEVENQWKNDALKPSTLKRISDLVSTYGPSATFVVDVLARLVGLK